MPEDLAAAIVHVLLAPEYPWEQFEERLITGEYSHWNRAVCLVADILRKNAPDTRLYSAVTRDGHLGPIHFRAWAASRDSDLGYADSNLSVWLRAVAVAVEAMTEEESK